MHQSRILPPSSAHVASCWAAQQKSRTGANLPSRESTREKTSCVRIGQSRSLRKRFKRCRWYWADMQTWFTCSFMDRFSFRTTPRFFTDRDRDSSSPEMVSLPEVLMWCSERPERARSASVLATLSWSRFAAIHRLISSMQRVRRVISTVWSSWTLFTSLFFV